MFAVTACAQLACASDVYLKRLFHRHLGEIQGLARSGVEQQEMIFLPTHGLVGRAFYANNPPGEGKS